MIIDDQHEFVFIHIPKCAGTSVRTVLERFDTAGGAFRVTNGEHPELGRIDMAHLPLAILGEFFPGTFEKIRSYRSFAVLRDPMTRFPSSLYQRLRMYGGKPIGEMKKDDVRRAIDETIEYLLINERQHLLQREFIHFQRQHSYIFHDGVRIVRNLYSTRDIERLLADVGMVVGEDLKSGAGVSHANTSATFVRSPAVGIVAELVRPIYARTVKPFLPSTLRKRVKGLVYEGLNEKFADLFKAPAVESFVRRFYKEDLLLFEALRSSQDAA